MELYCVVGGQTDSLKRWEADLNAQFLPLYKDGKKVKFEDGGLTHRRLLVSPIQLYKVCFPREELENVLSMVCPSDYINKRYSILDKGLRVLKRILGLKPTPKPKFENPFLQPNQVDKAVFVVPIGLKEDKVDNGIEQI
jgi:hypothetical protein